MQKQSTRRFVRTRASKGPWCPGPDRCPDCDPQVTRPPTVRKPLGEAWNAEHDPGDGRRGVHWRRLCPATTGRPAAGPARQSRQADLRRQPRLARTGQRRPPARLRPRRYRRPRAGRPVARRADPVGRRQLRRRDPRGSLDRRPPAPLSTPTFSAPSSCSPQRSPTGGAWTPPGATPSDSFTSRPTRSTARLAPRASSPRRPPTTPTRPTRPPRPPPTTSSAPSTRPTACPR